MSWWEGKEASSKTRGEYIGRTLRKICQFGSIGEVVRLFLVSCNWRAKDLEYFLSRAY